MKWSPSLRAKVIFFCLACAVLLGFLLTLSTLYAVEARKRQIVANARELLQLRADRLSERLKEMLDEEKVSDFETLRQSERFQVFRLALVRDETVQIALIYDHEGKRYEYWISPEAQDKFVVQAETIEVDSLAEARRSIQIDGETRGDLYLKYDPGLLLGQIQKEGRQITQWLLGLAGALTVLLAATFWLLWRVFQRHLERERVHEQLDRMAYVGTLASGLAHEIRNPLNSLGLNLDVITEEMEEPQPDSPQRMRKILGLLKTETARLNATLTNFLQFALPGQGDFQMTDVVAILHETAALLEPDMRRQGIRCRFEGERSCVTHADPKALRQVFWNILLNAVQALDGRDDRRVEMHCRVENDECRIEICDTGPGIPADRREQVFEVFHTTRPGGSGFGLPIARQVIERHGGSIWIDSDGGWGCVVHVTLPLRIGERTQKGNVSET